MASQAIRAGKAAIELFLDDSGLSREFRLIRQRFARFGQTLATVGVSSIALGAGLAASFIPAIRAASDYEETLSKFNVVYGQLADGQRAWIEDLADRVGRSRLLLTQFSAEFQDLLVPIGVDQESAAQLSRTLTSLSVDLASFNNLQDADVARDLSAALTGSSEVMKKYGVVVNVAAVNQQLLNEGLDPKNATEAEKAIARLNIILGGTTAAQGDAIRTSGSFANQLKALQADLTNTAVSIGQALLPVLTRFVRGIREFTAPLAQFIRDNEQLVIQIGAAAVGLVALGSALVTAGAVASGLSATIGLLGGAFTALASPISGAVLAMGILGSTFVDFESIVADSATFVLNDLTDAFNDINALIKSQDFSAATELAFLTILDGYGRASRRIIADTSKGLFEGLAIGSARDAEASASLFEGLTGISLGDDAERRRATQRAERQQSNEQRRQALAAQAQREAFRQQQKQEARERENARKQEERAAKRAADAQSRIDQALQSERDRQDKERTDKVNKELEQLENRAKQITQEFRTPDQVFADTIRELRDLLNRGLIDLETANRAAKTAQDALREAGRNLDAEKLQTAADRIRESLKSSSEILVDRVEEAAELLRRGFLDPSTFSDLVAQTRRELLDVGPSFEPTARSAGALVSDLITRSFDPTGRQSAEKRRADVEKKQLQRLQSIDRTLKRSGTWR